MKLLNKIKNKIKFGLALKAIKFSLVINQPALTAVIFWLLVGLFRPRKQYRVLCLGRSVFYDDIAAMKKYSGQINYVIIHFVYWQVLYDHFTPSTQRKQITEFNYHTTSLLVAERQQYYQYLNKLLPFLKRLLGFQAILSGNIGYVVQQELARAADHQHIPLIILHKEALDVYGSYHKIAKDYKFIGAKVLFYNEKIREALLALPIAGLTTDKCRVVGIPRFDSYLTEPFVNDNPVKQLVFFGFYTSDRLTNLITDPAQLETVRQQYTDFHKMIMTFAVHHPDIKVIIKTKPSQHYYNYVKDIFSNNFKSAIPNLTITGIGSAKELIRQSIAVISFGSTAVIEAVIANRPVISPDFNDLIEIDDSWNFFAKYPELVHYVRTGQDLDDYIKKIKAVTVDQVAREKFLTEIVGCPDGRASQRAENAIIRTIEEYEH